jgi:anti-sigma-K factor RskA
MSAVETTGDRVQDVARVATVTTLPHLAPAVEPKPKRVAKVAELVTPPDLWSDDRPSLRKIWLYGVYGRWTAADGFWRYAGAAWATVVALPITTGLYLLQWLVERPARFIVAATVVGLAKLAL